MSENTKYPEIKGKVVEIVPEFRNSAGTYWKQEIVVETGFRFPNPLKVSFQKEGTAHLEGVRPGDCVIIPYVLNGRRWDGPNGVRYFVDIVGMGLSKIEGRAASHEAQPAAPAAAPASAASPVLGCSMETAIQAWTKHHGEDIQAFAAFCREARPDIVAEAAAKGQKFTTYARNRIDVWGDILNRIEEAAAQAAQPAAQEFTDSDDMPF